MPRTAVNVTDDMVAAVLVGKTEGEKLPDDLLSWKPDCLNTDPLLPFDLNGRRGFLSENKTKEKIIGILGGMAPEATIDLGKMVIAHNNGFLLARLSHSN